MTLHQCHNRSYDIIDNDRDTLVSGQSLTEMLAPANKSSEAENLTESNDELIIRLEAKLVASEIELQTERDKRTSLQNQVDHLMLQINQTKRRKNIKNMKQGNWLMKTTN